jgi:hypothetical protein
MKNIKVGIDAFNDLAQSHDAHVKEVERLQKELDELNKLKLVDQKGELLLECKVDDKYHQLLLEVGLNTILERVLFEYESGGDFLGYDDLLKNPSEWESATDKEIICYNCKKDLEDV